MPCRRSSPAGILPSAMEIMDTLTIQAAEEAYHPGYPDGAGSVLLVELDGVAAQVEEDVAAVDALCRAAGAFEIRTASDAESRTLLWLGRKGAFAAMGRVSPDYYVQDGVVPRTKLPAVLRRIDELSRRARPPRRERVPRRGREPPPARPVRRAHRRPGRACEGARGRDPRGVRRRGRLAHGRARDRRRQGVLRCRRCSPNEISRSSSASAAPSTRTGSRTPARSSPRRACAERCPAPTGAPARASGPGGALLMRPATVEEASALLAEASAEGRRVRIGARRLDCRARPRPGARGRRPDLHRRGGDPAVGAPRERSRRRGSGCPSTRPATRRSGHASPPASRGRCPTATGRRAISSSA